MGLARFIKHTLVPGTYTADMVKNMVDEGSIVEGYKKTVKQEIIEDNPITSPVYKAGKYDGKKEGYAEASDEYEKKLLDQAEEFLNQKKNFEKEREDYEKLLDEYEIEINMLTKKANKSEGEKGYLQELLLMERKLRRMAE